MAYGDKHAAAQALAKGMGASGPLALLAARFPQLYVVPAEGAEEAWRTAAGRGIAPEGANLSHFTGTPDDELREVETPAGPVQVLFLKNRGDFETFLQVIGHKAQPVPIARTVGAITYRGLADWGKVAAARESYLAAGGDDWASEFSRLAHEPGAFRAELIVISEGPYSNLSAERTPYDEEEWVRISREVRLHHECAHVVCRRLMPDNVLPVWDEITADVTGLLCATGGYDAHLAGLFLGVSEDGYQGGRLEEYLTDEQKERIDEVAAEVARALVAIEERCSEAEASDPFGFLLQLKDQPLVQF